MATNDFPTAATLTTLGPTTRCLIIVGGSPNTYLGVCNRLETPVFKLDGDGNVYITGNVINMKEIED